jgi:hypothetical protein
MLAMAGHYLVLGSEATRARRSGASADEASPTSEESVKAVLAGIRRTVRAAPVRKKAATADLSYSNQGLSGERPQTAKKKGESACEVAEFFRILSIADSQWWWSVPPAA